MPSQVRTLTDELVMRRVQADCQLAKGELVRRFSPKMYNLTGRILRMPEDVDYVEDAVQDAWYGIFRGAERFGFRSNVSTWIFRVTYNSALQAYRKNRQLLRQNTISLERLPEYGQSLSDWRQPDPADVVAHREVDELLTRALSLASPSNTLAFRMTVLQGYSQTETAVLFDTTKNRVRRSLAQARRTLQEELVPRLCRDLRFKKA